MSRSVRSPALESIAESFRRAMACVPAAVSITTTRDSEGRAWGFTASSFTSLSMSPPLLLVCLNRSAECHQAFIEAEQFAINVIGPADQDLAVLFATRGENKFTSDRLGERAGLPVLERAVAGFTCSLHSQMEAGDHTILIGEVKEAWSRPIQPVIHLQGRFQMVGP